MNHPINTNILPLSANQRKYIRSLQHKKNRLQEKLYLAEGIKLVEEAHQTNQPIHAIVVTTDLLPTINLFKRNDFISKHIPIYVCNRSVFESLTEMQHPEGILSLIHLTDTKVNTIENSGAFFLEDLQDPGNVGTLIRIAAWFGLSTIYYTPETTDPFSPKVVRASMGAIFRVALIQIQQRAAFLAAHSHRLVAAVLDSNKLLPATALPANPIFWLGNETRGITQIPDNILQIRIPGGKSGTESLNVAVAGGILAYQSMYHTLL